MSLSVVSNNNTVIMINNICALSVFVLSEKTSHHIIGISHRKSTPMVRLYGKGDRYALLTIAIPLMYTKECVT